ncbi:obscurin [Dermacentor silvarum]|uniref:obscurin n=1 Tax=Dermacentor silvarum TaxID=543639 RepID=UPI00210122EB|nr:obscurin [Dermacentor silvarum]
MGCNLGKGSQPDDSDVRDKSNATSPQTPPPGMLADRMADGAAMVNKACNDVQHVYREKALENHHDHQDPESAEDEQQPNHQRPGSEEDAQAAAEAATKIQATFRAYKVRKEVRLGGSSAGGSEANLSQSHADPAMKEPEEENLADIDLTDPSLNQAASKIQATFRGHRVRKSPLHEPKNPGDKEQEGEAKDQVDDADKELPDELKDMDLNDPDLAKAAVKIQATFRGYKTRAKPE